MDTTHTLGQPVTVYSEDTLGMVPATVAGHLGDLVGVQTLDDVTRNVICYLPAEAVHAATA